MLLFTKCPSCGRRFRVRQVARRMTDDDREVETVNKSVLVPGGRGRNFGTGNPVQVTSVVTTERETYEADFECRSCGHHWSEKVTKVSRS